MLIDTQPQTQCRAVQPPDTRLYIPIEPVLSFLPLLFPSETHNSKLTPTHTRPQHPQKLIQQHGRLRHLLLLQRKHLQWWLQMQWLRRTCFSFSPPAALSSLNLFCFRTLTPTAEALSAAGTSLNKSHGVSGGYFVMRALAGAGGDDGKRTDTHGTK